MPPAMKRVLLPIVIFGFLAALLLGVAFGIIPIIGGSVHDRVNGSSEACVEHWADGDIWEHDVTVQADDPTYHVTLSDGDGGAVLGCIVEWAGDDAIVVDTEDYAE